ADLYIAGEGAVRAPCRPWNRARPPGVAPANRGRPHLSPPSRRAPRYAAPAPAERCCPLDVYRFVRGRAPGCALTAVARSSATCYHVVSPCNPSIVRKLRSVIVKRMALLDNLQFHEPNPFAEPLWVDENGRVLRFMLKPG